MGIKLVSDPEVLKVISKFKKHLTQRCQVARGINEFGPEGEAEYKRLHNTFNSILGEEKLKDIGDQYCRTLMNALRAKTTNTNAENKFDSA